jgi:hypothetical protein
VGVAGKVDAGSLAARVDQTVAGEDSVGGSNLMADSDLVEGFFDELSRRGHDPLLQRMDGTGRIEVVKGGRTDCWLVTVKGGDITVARGGGDADWVLRAERATFGEVIHGESGVLAAYLSGEIDIVFQDPSMRLGMIRRLFAGPSDRRQWTRDERPAAR